MLAVNVCRLDSGGFQGALKENPFGFIVLPRPHAVLLSKWQ